MGRTFLQEREVFPPTGFPPRKRSLFGGKFLGGIERAGSEESGLRKSSGKRVGGILLEALEESWSF